METIRDVIKTLFHRIQTHVLLEELKNNPQKYVDSQISKYAFCKQLSYCGNGSMTLDQMESIYNHMKDYWMKSPEGVHLCFSGRKSFFNVLLHFSSVVLSERNQQPVCHYEHLLRWHDVTSLLGEDLLTTSFLASRDLWGHVHRSTFCWPYIIEHDNRMLNGMLKNPLSDIHFHLKGSSLNFELNWMSLMNKTMGWEKQFTRLHQIQHRSSAVCDDETFEPLYLCVIKAAALRMLLFEYVISGHTTSAIKKDIEIVEHILSSSSVKMAIPHAKMLDVMLQRLRHINGKRYVGNDCSMRIPDYATIDRIIIGIEKSDYHYAFTTLSGERWLMYELFRDIYSKNNISQQVVAWFYTYLLYKSRFRTELVQNNGMIGFANFSLYERRKSQFIRERSVYNTLLSQLAVLGFLQGKENRYVEVRITPKTSMKQLVKALRRTTRDISDGHFFSKTDDDFSKYYNIVLHFIKKNDETSLKMAPKGECRHYKLRYDVKRQSLAISNLRKSNHAVRHMVVGIDAANSEIYARPEVFAQAYRYLRESTMSPGCTAHDLGMTYHVGEDFYDIIDGMRAIDEVLKFMQFRNGDRIGHGMVLGIDAQAYYSHFHNNVILPKQVLLDDVVWLYYKGRDLSEFTAASQELEVLFETYYMQLYGHTGRRDSMWTYHLSWQLRGDNPQYYYNANTTGIHRVNSKWAKFNLNDTKEACLARENEDARRLYDNYHFDRMVREKGKETVSFHVTKAIMDYISAVQKKMLDEIEKINICVECNPTSNLRIGHFDSYSTHPIVRMYNYQMPIEEDRHCISVSINTDDKGVFTTSLEREYSLLALSMEKKYVSKGLCSPRQIYDWLNNIRQMADEQRF